MIRKTVPIRVIQRSKKPKSLSRLRKRQDGRKRNAERRTEAIFETGSPDLSKVYLGPILS